MNTGQTDRQTEKDRERQRKKERDRETETERPRKGGRFIYFTFFSLLISRGFGIFLRIPVYFHRILDKRRSGSEILILKRFEIHTIRRCFEASEREMKFSIHMPKKPIFQKS